MGSCACMGPQRGAPLCPCRMRGLSAYQSAESVSLLLGGWNLIGDAPRNGTHILACDTSQSFGWMDGKPLPPVQTVVHWFDDGFYTSVNETEPQRPFTATHWKPLDGPLDPETSSAGVAP